MQPFDVQQEQNRLSQAYREMGDEELEAIAAQAYDLTDVARECLSFEISSRGSKIPLSLEPPSEEELEVLPPRDDGFVSDNADLTPIATAVSAEELQRLQALLTRGGFEHFLGDENVRDLKDLRDDLASGVEIKVWSAEAQKAMGYLAYNSRDEAAQNDSEDDVSMVLCPRCKSDGVIFEERAVDETNGKLQRSSKFRWRCDDCGHEWEDDGVTS